MSFKILNEEKSMQNMKNALCYILLLSEEGLQPLNHLEIQWAIKFQKKIIVVCFEKAPVDQVKHLLKDHPFVEYIPTTKATYDADLEEKILPLMDKYKKEDS